VFRGKDLVKSQLASICRRVEGFVVRMNRVIGLQTRTDR
jgi:hypothetical protein